jgi:transposase
MIQITAQMRIWLAVEPVDFRKGIDDLAQVCRQPLKVDPMAGALVVFSSRRRKALKCLVFDGQGFWLCQKRLSTGRFAWWPTDAKPPTFGLDAHQLQSLLWNAKPPAHSQRRCGGLLRLRVNAWVVLWAAGKNISSCSPASVVKGIAS